MIGGINLALFAVIGLGAVSLFGLTAWRPAIGCGALALAVPLSTGLGRGTLVPLLRPNEVVLLVVLVGLIVHQLPRPQRRPVTALDVAVGTFTIGSILIPALVLFLDHTKTDFVTWRTVLSPVQFLAIYLIFSRTPLSARAVTLCVSLAFAASVIVGLLAVAELKDFAGARSFVAGYFPSNIPIPSWDPVYRPSSTLGYYSSLGAFAVLNFTLALALATVRHPSFRGPWLTIVMVVNAVATLASLVWAASFALVPAALLVVWYGRRIPRHLAVVAVATAFVGLVVLGVNVATRAQQQQVGFGGPAASLIPQTLHYRMDLWSQFFVPALVEKQPWVGTGTIIPSVVPEELWPAVDSEYLRTGFRAGLAGLVLLAGLLTTIAISSWAARDSEDPLRRALGASALTYVVALVIMGVTAEYLSFAGASQMIAMVTGLLTAFSRPQPAASPLVTVIYTPGAHRG